MSTRREFLRGASSAMALSIAGVRPVAAAAPMQPRRGPKAEVYSLNDGWSFGYATAEGSAASQRVNLPHCVAKLSWQGWNPESWQREWVYRRAVDMLPGASPTQRVFLRFEGVMSGATPVWNGTRLEPNAGGFLPFEREITGMVKAKNELVVEVDGRWINVPPEGGPKGPPQIDYLLPAGIHRDVTLRVVPETFVKDVFAKPVDVLKASRRVEVQCTIDTRRAGGGPVRVEAVLLDGDSEVGRETTTARLEGPGTVESKLVIAGLSDISLWSPETPKLYGLHVTLRDASGVLHAYTTRIGFREAKFTVDGFFLNGKRTRIFGLNRHELYPYAGFAMPERAKRRDAEMLRHEFNCNMVRCSHYPQSEAFLDACDELGLMVWEEIPGWQYLGDHTWRELLCRDVKNMVVRDRNHASIVIWGVRVNESANDVELYTRTKEIARTLDDSRQTSGTMTQYSTANWLQDVFAYDDYHSDADGSVGMREPLPGVPFFFSEGVGQYQYEHGKGFKQYYRRAGADRSIQEGQARYHAQGHDRAARNERCGGLIAWCAFDYASQLNGYNAVKCPGIADTFRIPKLGAAFYRSQVSAAERPVIEPDFYWDFDPESGRGPGKGAFIFSNCDRLVVEVGNAPPMTLQADKAAYPHLTHPPFVADLTAEAKEHPELRIEGYVGDQRVLTRVFSADRSQDQLLLQVDDGAITADMQDATRVWFAVCDRYGASVPCLDGEVTVEMDGPAEIIGDSSFVLQDTGGVGAVWVRSNSKASGRAVIRAIHPRFGSKSVKVELHSVKGA